MSEDIRNIAEYIYTKKAILFVGAGISANLGLPDWSQLISEMVRQLGFEPEIFAPQGVNYLTIGEYYRLEKGKIGALRSWMDRSWSVSDEVLKESAVHNLIVDLAFPLIYTTNYDRNIEKIYELRAQKYIKITNLNDIALADDRATHIVKFHGDFDDDSSIVLSESDYYDRLDFGSPLDVKLRSDLLGKTIIFIGYSLSDVNVRLLIYRLNRLWKDYGRVADRPRSYIVMTTPSILQEKVLQSWNITPIIPDADSVSQGIENVLADIKAQISYLASKFASKSRS